MKKCYINREKFIEFIGDKKGVLFVDYQFSFDKTGYHCGDLPFYLLNGGGKCVYGMYFKDGYRSVKWRRVDKYMIMKEKFTEAEFMCEDDNERYCYAESGIFTYMVYDDDWDGEFRVWVD